MKKVIFIFLILISCLCLAVVSCADKEESSTSSSSTDGSASGYMKIGNMLMVWGDTSSSANFPISFAATPTVTATVTDLVSRGSNVTIESVTTSSVTLGLSSGETANYIAVGKWQ